MTRLRIGTRGSKLALIQTRWVCEQLRAQIPDLTIDELIIATHGDRHPGHAVAADDWPMGGFTSAIECALLDKRIDFAVHSMKDLPVVQTPGTHIAAIPARAAGHDVLVTAKPISLDDFPPHFRIGTSSPRRAAQIKRLGPVQTVPIRGNVPTRIARVGGDLDAVILAAAGLSRLGIKPRHTIDLPLARFLPAAGQGAIAVQVRAEDDEVAKMIATIDDPDKRAAVEAERMFLAGMGGGCSAPIGAHATVHEGIVTLHGQVFFGDGGKELYGTADGESPSGVAATLADTLSRRIAEVRG